MTRVSSVSLLHGANVHGLELFSLPLPVNRRSLVRTCMPGMSACITAPPPPTCSVVDRRREISFRLSVHRRKRAPRARPPDSSLHFLRRNAPPRSSCVSLQAAAPTLTPSLPLGLSDGKFDSPCGRCQDTSDPRHFAVSERCKAELT